jgi:hypothetical protein
MTMEALLESNKTIREAKEEKCERGIHPSLDETGKLPNTGPRANAARHKPAYLTTWRDEVRERPVTTRRAP